MKKQHWQALTDRRISQTCDQGKKILFQHIRLMNFRDIVYSDSPQWDASIAHIFIIFPRFLSGRQYFDRLGTLIDDLPDNGSTESLNFYMDVTALMKSINWCIHRLKKWFFFLSGLCLSTTVDDSRLMRTYMIEGAMFLIIQSVGDQIITGATTQS
jgi:hypothetical protein